MDMLIIMTYTALCIVIFKVFKIPLNKWSVPTALLGGVIVLGAITFIMNYNHPYAKNAKDFFVSVPIASKRTGTVTEVHVGLNQRVKKGDKLYTVENDTYRAEVQRAEAALEEAKNRVLQDDAQLTAARANTERALVEKERKFLNYDKYRRGHQQATPGASPFTQMELDNRKGLYEAAIAAHEAAQAEEKRIFLNSTSKINGLDTEVAKLYAELETAKIQLDRSTIYAPSDGTIVLNRLREGGRAPSFLVGASMTFIPDQKRQIAGAFWQNNVERLEVGMPAEVILDAAPGKVFTGRLVEVVPAISSGEIQQGGRLPALTNMGRTAKVIGIIELDENLDDYNLPVGLQGSAVVINTDHDYIHASIVRRILLRMMAWLKYIYPVK